ncbi:hypothetical protein TCAL_14464 [Tigriopus californicus]|uniref:HTH OST-type domain-containing protein n=1 Tax=Tigriopus californicus TaxID=6832 RepID=A0A553PSI3_TIGCA|nr:hypothetical protein TCAL_14464 [Tigriopus californicus]
MNQLIRVREAESNQSPKIRLIDRSYIKLLPRTEHDKLYCSDLEALFAEKYKTALSPGQYGYPNIKNLLESGLSKHFTIRGRGSRKVICVAKEMPEKSQDSSTIVVVLQLCAHATFPPGWRFLQPTSFSSWFISNRCGSCWQ